MPGNLGSWDPRLLQYSSFGYGPLHPVEHLSGTMTLPQRMNSTPSEHPYLSQNMDSTLSRPHPSQIDTSTPSRNPSGFNVVPGTPSPKPPSFSTLAKIPPSPILPEDTHHESIVTITNHQTNISDELMITSDHTVDHKAIEPPVERYIDAHVKTSELLAEVEITDDNGTETVVENHSGDDKGTEAVLPQEDNNIGDTGSFVGVIQKDDQDTQTQRVEEDVDMSDSKDSASSPEETDGKSEASMNSTQSGIPLSRVDADRRYARWSRGIVGGSGYWSSGSPSPYRPAGMGTFTGAIRRDVFHIEFGL